MAVLEGNVAFANLDEHEEYQGQSTGKYSLVLSLEPADADKLANQGVKLREYEGWSPGQPGFPSNGRIAWALWGGDAGWNWAKRIYAGLQK